MMGVSKSWTYVGGSGDNSVDGSGDRLWNQHGRRTRIDGCSCAIDIDDRAADRQATHWDLRGKKIEKDERRRQCKSREH